MDAPNITLAKLNSAQKQVWMNHAVAALLYCLLLLIIYLETSWSMVHTWWRSETFAHGFLIFPISIWLLWDKRQSLIWILPSQNKRALVAVALSGSIWLAGNLVDALVVQQFALIGLLVSGLWTILGNRVTWAMSFPLAYLFFAVPVGEDLVPPLMELTATFTVELLKFTGIPVFREGLYFSLPTGNWSVVEACSGIRYLIASVTLGCLYAYLTYQSAYKRTVFILFSIGLPILANGLRAYMIVMLGHWSNMKIATGVDHLIYGWIFFGLVMMLLFWVGAKWRDPVPEVDTHQAQEALQEQTSVNRSHSVLLSVVVLIVAGGWAGVASTLNSKEFAISDTKLTTPSLIGGWQATDESYWTWSPLLVGADKRADRFYFKGERRVSLSVGQYLSQHQDQEMVNTQNFLVDPDQHVWRLTSTNKRTSNLKGQLLELDEATVNGHGGAHLLIWAWYRIGDRSTSNPYLAKIYEAWKKITLQPYSGTKIVIAIQYEGNANSGVKTLNEFANAVLPAVELNIDKVNTHLQ